MSHHKNAIDFLKEELEVNHPCTRSSCKGTMIKVYTKYEDHGPINEEWECCSCGKVRKDERFAQQRRKQYEERQARRRERQQPQDKSNRAK